MKCKFKLIPVYALLCISTARAQTWDWVKNVGGKEQNIANGISKDASGNIYLTGCFGMTGRFGSATDTLVSKGANDLYIAKYNNSGNLLWVRSAGGSQFDMAFGVAAIPGGGCYVSGFITDTVVVGNDTLDGGFGGNSFVAKYDAGGALQWIRTASSIYDNYAHSVATLPDGGCVVTGYFRQNATFGSQTVHHSGTFSGGESDIFIARYNGQGDLLWVKGAGGYRAYCKGNSIGCDLNGNIYLTGSFSQTATFDHLSLTANESIAGLGGEDDLFVAKYNNNGQIQWVKKAGGGGNPDFIQSADIGRSIAVAPNGTCYVTGSVYGTVKFDNITLQSSGNRDGFVAKYNSDGTVGWAKLTGGPGEDQVDAVSIDDNQHVYICGEFTQSFSLGSMLVSQGLLDGFVAALMPDGTVSWVTSLGSDQSEHCSGIDAGNDALTVTGRYASASVNFGSTTLTMTDGSVQGYDDVFFGKITPPITPTGITNVGTKEIDVKLYPNPCEDKLHFLPAQEGEYELTITDATGRSVLNTIAKAGPGRAISIQLNVAPGNYMYRLCHEGRQATGIFTKE